MQSVESLQNRRKSEGSGFTGNMNKVAPGIQAAEFNWQACQRAVILVIPFQSFSCPRISGLGIQSPRERIWFVWHLNLICHILQLSLGKPPTCGPQGLQTTGKNEILPERVERYVRNKGKWTIIIQFSGNIGKSDALELRSQVQISVILFCSCVTPAWAFLVLVPQLPHSKI